MRYKYFLRFTDTPKSDLVRGTSINASDFAGSIEEAAKMFGCNKNQIKIINGSYCQVLNGLCGYELEATTVLEAIQEVRSSNKQFAFVGKACIFEGEYATDSKYVPDGDLFIPKSIIVVLEDKDLL